VKAFRFAADLERDPPEAAELWALGCRGLQQDGGDVLAWFDEERPLPLSGVWEDEDGTDWVAAYLAELAPVHLGMLVIAPSHAEVTVRVGQRPLWLDPGMAFGTGHHETTRMALAALERLDPWDRRVLDVGSGSGILAIAADLLGAREALGVDVDEATLPIARDNARLNRSRARFRAGSVEAAGQAGGWDLLVANLYAELHARLAPAYRAALAPNGRALLTGILAERAAVVEEALADDWAIVARVEDGPWRLIEAVPR
jgi:ribosomal protein L11 methyltransferase